VKLAGGDIEWRNFTAMDEYYQNGPLPTWIGWYVEHLPHWFHAATVAGTLALELLLVFMMFFPRRVRLVCFFIVTPWEIGVILTANYTFLNYLVLSLGFLLLDDKFLLRFVPARFLPHEPEPVALPEPASEDDHPLSILAGAPGPDSGTWENSKPDLPGAPEPAPSLPGAPGPDSGTWEISKTDLRTRLGDFFSAFALVFAAVMLTWIAYDTTAEMMGIPMRESILPDKPIVLLEPFRIANQYGLFAVMTRGRYEIEFQGSSDGQTWTAYSFRNKPQALNEAPRIYAPYQPRFDWNLWFASLGGWRQNEIVPLTEEKLLANNADVLSLFRGNPFAQMAPRYVRAVLWQYWFTTMDEKRSTGNWWRREYLGLYAPELTMTADGNFAAVAFPDELPPHE